MTVVVVAYVAVRKFNNGATVWLCSKGHVSSEEPSEPGSAATGHQGQ